MMTGKNGTKPHATLYDFRDLDLMLKLDAEGGEAETWELTEALGFGENGRMPVARRLSWMKHYGMLEFDEKRHLWRLSKGGERVVHARMRAAASRQIEALPDEAMIDVMASVTTRYRHGEPMIADLLRREFLFGTQRGRR
jgi:hypothetical protein